MKVGFTIGHVGRTKDDWGVSPGTVPEAYAVSQYVWSCALSLRMNGHTSIISSDGEYSSQWTRHAKHHESLYLNCHLNAFDGNADYGAIFIDYRTSDLNRKRARIFAAYMAEKLPVSSFKVIEARHTDWTKNAYYTIRGAKAFAWCLEPLFYDHAKHREWMKENDLGLLISEGILRAYSK